MPYRVDKPARPLQALKAFHLDRRVADDIEELFVTPDVVLERGDIEIADQDDTLLPRRMQF